MGTKWKDFTAEQKEEVNRKRREKYAALDVEKKAAKLEADKIRLANQSEEQKEERNSRRRRQCPKVYRLSEAMGGGEVTDPATCEWYFKAEKRAERRRQGFENRMKEIQEWSDAGGLFPWPAMRRKMEATRLFIQVKEKLGGCCSQCGTKDCWEWSWRISLKKDFMAFVGSRTEDMEKVLKNPEDYAMYCVTCTFDLRIYCFAWVFSPYSPRNDPKSTLKQFLPKYANWEEKVKWMYPPGKALEERIDNGVVKSLKYKVPYKDGSMIYGFLRKDRYHDYIGANPRKLAWTEIGYSLGTVS